MLSGPLGAGSSPTRVGPLQPWEQGLPPRSMGAAGPSARPSNTAPGPLPALQLPRRPHTQRPEFGPGPPPPIPTPRLDAARPPAARALREGGVGARRGRAYLQALGEGTEEHQVRQAPQPPHDGRPAGARARLGSASAPAPRAGPQRPRCRRPPRAPARRVPARARASASGRREEALGGARGRSGEEGAGVLRGRAGAWEGMWTREEGWGGGAARVRDPEGQRVWARSGAAVLREGRRRPRLPASAPHLG